LPIKRVFNRQSAITKSAMFRDPLNLMRLAPSKGETATVTVPSFDGAVFVFFGARASVQAVRAPAALGWLGGRFAAHAARLQSCFTPKA
jgi:hypothetical protein